MQSLRLALFLALGALSVPATAQTGAVLRAQKINELFGGFGGALAPDDTFGSALAALGDLDGDGIGDVAVGAPGDDDGGPARGAIWILFLNADSSVKAHQKISQTQGGFTGTLSDGASLGRRLACVGDLDGDGAPELVAQPGGPLRLLVLFLNANGTVKSHTESFYSDPVFVPATQARFLGGGLCALGDLDGDGLGDLAVGAPRDPDGGTRAGALWILYLDAAGTLKAAHKIGPGQGGFTGVLEEGDEFGSSLVHLGDLDGDGNRELGVSSPFGGALGDFWVLHLDASEQVITQREFGIPDYGLQWPSGIGFGTSDAYASLGDLDGDGIDELAIEFGGHNFPGGADQEGGLAIAFLRSDGSVRKRLRISDNRGGLGALPGRTGFGTPLCSLGDIDGDGTPELAVGAIFDRAAGDVTGAVWILSLDPDALRNGAGGNPHSLSQAAEPVFATNWLVTLDCSGHAAAPAMLFARSSPVAGFLTPFGEVLIGGTPLFQAQVLHASGPALFTNAVPPYDLALIDLPLFTQGLCLGAPGPRLSNALDVLVGQ